MPGERYFTVRDRLSELLGWIGELADEVGLEPEPEHPAPVLSQPVLIAVIGEVNAGKSSLLNALAGAPLCPAGPLPETREIRLYRHGEEADHPVQPLLVECRRSLDHLRNFDLLDTPGTNARGSDHAAVLEPFLEHADLVLVVFTAENPWTAATWDAVSRLSPEALARTALVVQRVDLKQPLDIPIILGHMRDLSLKRVGQVLPIFPVAAEVALEAKQAEPVSRELWTASRFSALEHFISERICDSMERRQLLHDGWHHASRTLRRLEGRFDVQRRGMEDDAWFLSGIEREMDELRDASLDEAPRRLGEALERYRSEVDVVVRRLRSKLGWWRSLARLFAGDGSAAQIEATFAARMQEVAIGFAQDEATRLVGSCENHWETVRPRVKERMGFEAGPCAVSGEEREGVIGRFVASLEKAVPQALASLRVRGVLDPLIRRRNATLKSFTVVGLLLVIAAAGCGLAAMQHAALLLLGGALAAFVVAAVAAWISRARLAAGYRDRLLAGAPTFAEGLKDEHGEAIRLLFRDHSSSLIGVRRRLAVERAALQPRLERSNSLYIALKSVELDL
jgi:hypothetical protein